jgi:hypothetical protein
MKTNFLKKFSGSLALSVLVLMPIASYAIGTPSVQINSGGKIIVTGAEVTSVSGDTITGVVKLKNATTSATIKTTASTTIEMKGGTQGTTSTSSVSGIRVGDILKVSGIFTGFTSSLTLTANKIRNLTSSLAVRLKAGKVESVNTSNNSFVLRTRDNKLVTVVTTASTTFKVPNKATSTFASAVSVNGNVEVLGLFNSSGTVFTATQVKFSNSQMYKEDEKNNSKSKKENKRFFGLWKLKNE